MKLLLLPHYDDEMFCIHHLQEWVRSSETPIEVVFLTREKDTALHNRRQSESRTVLQEMSGRIVIRDLGAELEIAPDDVSDHLPELFQSIARQGSRYESVVCPAVEGGHPDHDGAFFLGMKLARLTGAKLWVFSTYSEFDSVTPLFRVSGLPRSQSSSAHSASAVRLSLSQIFRSVFSTWSRYPSQRKTWALLSLPWLASLLFRRSETIYPVPTERFPSTASPWLGKKPLYERHGRAKGADCWKQQLDFLNSV